MASNPRPLTISELISNLERHRRIYGDALPVKLDTGMGASVPARQVAIYSGIVHVHGWPLNEDVIIHPGDSDDPNDAGRE